ncbi:MAG: hypothetical protein KF705_01565 [Phycisphaeraceae bacterium]|nr:hypothetical protein [Phycisphaeraceae bacterium]
MPFGVIGISTLMPMLSLLLLAMTGSWRAIPVAAAFLLLLVCAWRLMLAQATARVKKWPAALAILLVFMAMVIGLPCLAPIYAPAAGKERMVLEDRKQEIIQDFESRGITPGSKTGPAREIQRMQDTLTMKVALTALVWQYTLFSAALACFHAGRSRFDTGRLISDIERPTTFVLAAVGLVVSALVVTLKVCIAMGAVALESEIAAWIDRRVMAAVPPSGLATTDQVQAALSVAGGLTNELARWRSQVQDICALSIWELSLLASALSYFVASKLVPALPSRRRATPTWVYRLVAGLLVFGGSVAAFFTVIRAIQVLVFWPVEIRWQL